MRTRNPTTQRDEPQSPEREGLRQIRKPDPLIGQGSGQITAPEQSPEGSFELRRARLKGQHCCHCPLIKGAQQVSAEVEFPVHASSLT
ncbi:hypothetical protein THIARS_70555 [Thiomonas delicata]|uniref:Uncharacterized protein n=1 Tax=Thiomonas delicata TaxID=364030 RepID=A0A238D6R9_THIDL|nr:hypothetical protein THIARS_70555 [Thiomonas delicata]